MWVQRQLPKQRPVCMLVTHLYRSRQLCPSPGDLPDPEIELTGVEPMSPAQQADSLSSVPTREALDLPQSLLTLFQTADFLASVICSLRSTILYCITTVHSGLPMWLSGKEPTSQCRDTEDMSYTPWSGRSPLEKAMALHSSTLAWKMLWREEPGRLQSMGSLGVGHD